MTISDPQEAYVWIWLPGAKEPVVAGRLDQDGAIVTFTYRRAYRTGPDAIAIYAPELELGPGEIRPRIGTIAGCIKDAGPDSWGRRVITHRLLGGPGDIGSEPSDLTMLLESGSDRIGALDFQTSPDEYLPRREDRASLEDLAQAAELLDKGEELSPALDRALLAGSSVGGARPKALLDGDGGRRLIAKFSAINDTYPVVKGEFIAMELAGRVGLDVAGVDLTKAVGKDVLLVERFDRPGDGTRRAVVSAMTITEMDERGWFGSYALLAHTMRQRFRHAERDVHELFARIAFNIIVGNNDDHARNHAAFWDGKWLDLTPAYDVCPGPRGGGEIKQMMEIGDDGYRDSKLAGCVERAGTYLLNEKQAREIIDNQIEIVTRDWDEVCDLAELTAADRRLFWKRQFLNQSIFYGY